MKTIFSAVATLSLLVASSAFANNAQPQIEFHSTDNSFETSVCIIAAEFGLGTAYDVLRQNGSSIAKFNRKYDCNGMDLRTFARRMGNHIEDDQMDTALAKN
ncbi:hypothetical protein GCM10011369_31050 [Neiella marina]|uniref:DUF3718 domain-containing protein n=1 Tax=Neiella marina TaxID=508461 RepID=A0A8J2U8I5_9GAMM|nr:hypothetical protein [Neiella marina]GGA86793.1 hypothetical protein GCM10011369_31050 [Neiella marina]